MSMEGSRAWNAVDQLLLVHGRDQIPQASPYDDEVRWARDQRLEDAADVREMRAYLRYVATGEENVASYRYRMKREVITPIIAQLEVEATTLEMRHHISSGFKEYLECKGFRVYRRGHDDPVPRGTWSMQINTVITWN